MISEGRQADEIILFDGVCNVCNGSVNFILQRDVRGTFHFASIQSETGERILAGLGLPTNFNSTIILVEDGLPYFQSTAALKIAGKLRMPWPKLARLALAIPRPIRDRVYELIAGHRYRWFGRAEVCLVPSPRYASRFL